MIFVISLKEYQQYVLLVHYILTPNTINVVTWWRFLS